MSDSSRTTSQFLPDVPAEQDAFGPHLQVATTIEHMVLGDPGGLSIGLTGSYGSGKSTVVELLSRSLGKQTNACVWVFDAWAHEGDPLRRTFLESIIQRLLSERWIDKKRWEQHLRELTHRFRRTETKNTFRITPFAIALALALLVVPIGHALLRVGLPTAAPWLPGRELNIFATVGLILALLPIAVVALTFARARILQRKDPSHDPLEELGALLITQTANNVQTTTTESTDPTSIEFEHNFRSLMREALAVPDRRLVIVVDNLDRVEPEDAQRVWSTLRTFVDRTSEKQREEWMSRLWVIIPYDPRGIRRLWQQRASADKNNVESSLAKSFLDKTIDIRFHVPHPLLSNWRDYLIELLRMALPTSVEAIELHRIYRMLALSRNASSHSPTPRELKIFVNQISTTYRLRRADIPLPDIAYFTILDRDGHDIPTGLLRGSFPQPNKQHLVSPDVQLSLAALFFGVDREQGQQLLLAGPIMSALISGNESELARLQSLTPAFGAVLEHTLGEAAAEWVAFDSNETANLLTASRAIANAAILSSLGPTSRRHVQQILRAAAREAVHWTPLAPTIGTDILALNTLLKDPEVAEQSIRALSSTLVQSSGSEGLEPEDVGRVAIEIADGFEAIGLSAALEQQIEVPGGARPYLEALDVVVRAVRKLNDPDHKHLTVLRTSAEPHEMVGALAERASTGKFGETDFAAIRLLQGSRNEYDWETLVTEIATRFELDTFSGPVEVNMLLATLQFLIERVESTAAKDALHSLIRNRRCESAWRISAENPTEGTQAQARLLYAQMLVDPSFEYPQLGSGESVLQTALGDPSAGLAACLATLCENADRRDLLLDVGRASDEAKPLVGAVLRTLYDRGRSEAFFSADLIAEHWDLFPPDFDLEAALSSNMRRTSAIARGIERGPATPSNVALYRALLRCLQYKRQFANWLVEQLQAVSQETWLKDLRGKETWLGLAAELQQHAFSPGLSQSFRGALLEYADQLQSSNAPSLKLHGKHLGGLMDPSDRAIVEDRLLGILLADPLSLTGRFLLVFGAILRQHPRIVADDSILSRVFIPLVESRHIAGVRWIRNLVEERGDRFLASLDITRVRAFRRAISVELRDGPADQVRQDATVIARRLKIRRASAPRRRNRT